MAPALPRPQKTAASGGGGKSVALKAETEAEIDTEDTEELTEQEIINKDLGESIRRSKTPASEIDWSRDEGEGEKGIETRDIEMDDADQMHPARRERIKREESEDTPIPQQLARPLWLVGPRMENMSIAQQQQHQQR